MATAKEHYDRHLASFYSWMTGDFSALKARNAALFDRLGLEPVGAPLALDLGAGHGAQSIPLAERGFDVVAIDFCKPLLDELRERARGLSVTAVEDDLLELKKYAHAPVGAVVCMGDTLPHLPSRADVERLIDETSAVLADGGKLIVTFRDYVSREASGEARFIPVKADDEQILTCFLDYSADAVTVYDLLHRRVDGKWRQELSSYRKLRIDPEWLASICADAGLVPTERTVDGGMITFVAERQRR